MVDVGTMILVALTVISQVMIVWIIGESILKAASDKKTYSSILKWFHKNSMIIAFFVSLIATLGSLYYSDVLKYSPCVLCWYERICMYPQALLFALALWKKEQRVWLFAVALSIIGAVISGVHYYLQVAGSNKFCEIVGGYSASCSDTFSVNWGYITIPMMALSAFILIIALAFLQRKKI